MKGLLVLTLTGLLSLSLISGEAFAQQQSRTAGYHYNQGRSAFIDKRYAEAQEQFAKALAIDPNHGPSIAMMHRVSRAMPKANAQMLKYRSIVIPKVSFDQATFQSTLDYLREQAVEMSGGQVQPNFVVQAADQQKLRNKRITLNLENVPFLEVLRYACTLAQAQFEVQEFAILIRPLKDTPPEQAQPSPSPADTSRNTNGDGSPADPSPAPAQ